MNTIFNLLISSEPLIDEPEYEPENESEHQIEESESRDA